MHEDYKTMDAPYTESVWWAFSELNRKGLVSEGFKAMHLCPRCGTTLSNFEVAQGYEDIKDLSVTVKLKLHDEKDTYLLAWTTTPWTLPGNMASAVHKDEVYVSAELENGDIVILGKERVEDVLKDTPHQLVKEFKGKVLIGKTYEPPFPYFKQESFEHKENAWHIWHADYVSQEDGTGIVHLAPAFGAEDLELAREHNIPVIHHVGTDGKFVAAVEDFAGKLVKPKDDRDAGITHMDTDVEIIKKLAHDGILFAKEKIEHSYPHCWRCSTPLLNYAASSWFVTAPDIKNELLKANSKVGWVPEDIRDGRFGKWLEGVRDWAISRSRYWGAPIPVWKTEDGESVIIGSVEELKKYIPRSNNTYLGIRHGQSENNVKSLISSVKENIDPLTEKGRKQVEDALKA
jgi:isoleucyl-tRNA synthetase